MRRLVQIAALVVASVVFAGCGALEMRGPMSDGQRTYLSRCTSCHDAYEPHEYPPERWRKAVSEMEQEHGVHLSDEEKALILGYVAPVAAATAAGAAAPNHS